MTWLRQWWQRRQDRKVVRARLDQIQAEREAAEAVAQRDAIDRLRFRLMRSAA